MDGLDRWITGNYGEDQYTNHDLKEDMEMEQEMEEREREEREREDWGMLDYYDEDEFMREDVREARERWMGREGRRER